MEVDVLDQAPSIIQEMRDRTFGLGCHLFENDLKPEDLIYLDQHELRMLKNRTNRKDLLEKIAELLF
jgi:hypothetical protein